MPNCGQTHLTSTTLAFQSDSVLLQGGWKTLVWKLCRRTISRDFRLALWGLGFHSESSFFLSWSPGGLSFSFGRRSCKSNFPADGISPDTNATLEPWHFTSAECSLVIYYSFSVREAKTASEKTCSSLWSANREPSVSQTSAPSCVTLGKFICCALCSVVLSQTGSCS